MEQNIYLFFTGIAGSGKTSLVNAFKSWMDNGGLDCITVNLDPGAVRIPYDVDVDIRDWITLEGAMDEYTLGPNGAQIACADMLALHIGDIRETIRAYETNYILVDTPGQIELFAFRQSSRYIVDSLCDGRGMLVYLFEPHLSREPSGLISQMLLSTTMRFRFSLPTMNVLAKSDLLSPQELEKIEDMGDLDMLHDRAMGDVGLMGDLNFEIFKTMAAMEAFSPLTITSAHEGEGITDIYSLVQQCFAGGEDLSRD